MKRSEINTIIRDMEQLIQKYSFSLPPFCSWTADEWLVKGHEYDEIRDTMLGWDITDFGLGNFYKTGFALITLRNGNKKNDKYNKIYAEKLLMLRENQTAPLHYHWIKMEDIINRGGGTLIIRVYNGNKDKTINSSDVLIHKDGCRYFVKSGTEILLTPGESITLYPYQYHDFAVKKGTGDVLIGEVSMVNDDTNDNYFYENIGRFPKIEEDEKPYRLLCNEYPIAHN